MDYSWRWQEEDFTMTMGETITLHIMPVPGSGTEVFEDGISVGYIVREMYEYTPTTTGTHILQYGNVVDCRPLNITVVSNKKIFLKVRLDNIFQLISNKVTSWNQTPSDDKYPSEKLVKDSLDNHTHNSQISYGQVDSTSTSTVFTATVSNLTSLVDGATVMLRNGVVNSASGFTLNVNNLGAKPVYSSMHNATADTTIFKFDYTMLFTYDSTRINGGCWICYRGYNTNDNTIGYQIRTNSQKIYATDKTYRYRILLEVDDTHYMPVNLSTSTSADVSKTSTMNTREFKLGGNIIYYSYTSAVNQNAQFGNTYQWYQYPFNLGYSFNNTSSALTLTQWSPVYMVAEKSVTNEGMAKLVSPYYTQSLPNSEDGKLYIFLGQAYNTTNIEMVMEHPIYEYKNGNIRLYRDCYSTSETDTLLNGKANSSHTHTKSQITDFPSIPSKTSDLTNDSGFLTSHQSLTNYVQKSNTSGLLKNDGTVMQSGTGASNYSVGNHTHNYAEVIHNHTSSNLQDVEIVEVVVTYTDNTTETLKLLSKKTLGTTITISANPSTVIYYIPATTISGTLVDEDNNPISNANISFKLNNSTSHLGEDYPTVTTNSNGEYTLSIDGNNSRSVWYNSMIEGNNTLQAIFESDGLYASSDASVIIVGTGK